MRDEAFWRSLLPSDALQREVSDKTLVVADSSTAASQTSEVFGMLTTLGVEQMRTAGAKLAASLEATWPELTDSEVTVWSTAYARTILSTQALLSTMFPADRRTAPLTIDTRDSRQMVPDPLPRRTLRQEQLEAELSSAPAFVAAEAAMASLAQRVTHWLRESGALRSDADSVRFGVGDGNAVAGGTLPWSKLAEVTKCLAAHGKLPANVTEADVSAIQNYTARRWYALMGDARLAKEAMGPFASSLLHFFVARPKRMRVISAHDSTLIGVMCAYGLAPPESWPPYASVLRIELLQDAALEESVRFVLNGKAVPFRPQTELHLSGDRTIARLQSLLALHS
jgi:acid phosphatase